MQSCLNSIDFVLATHAVYVNADLTLLSLQTQCSCIAVALAEAEIMLKPGFVHRTDRGSRSLNEGHTHVRANFSDLLASYTYVFNSLQQRLDYLVRVIKGDDDRGNSRRSHREDSRNARSHLSRWSRLKFVWNQHEMNKLLRDVTSQTASLEFVLSVLRMCVFSSGPLICLRYFKRENADFDCSHCDIEAAPSVAFPLAVSVLDNVDRNAQLFKGGDDGIDSLVHDPGVMDMNAGNQEDDVLPFHQISISHGDRGRRKSRGRANTRNSKHTGPARRCDRVALGFSWNHLETETESESESEEDSLSRVKRCRIRLNERFPRSSRLDSRTDSLSPSPSRSSCCSIIPPPPASTYTINRVFDIFVAREMFLLMSMPASSSASPQPQFPLPSSWYFCRHQIQPNASSSQDQLRVQHPSQPQARSHHTDISCGAATHFRRLLALPPEQKWRVLHETKHRRDGSNWEDCNDGDWDSDRDYWSDDGVVNRSSRHWTCLVVSRIPTQNLSLTLSRRQASLVMMVTTIMTMTIEPLVI